MHIIISGMHRFNKFELVAQHHKYYVSAVNTNTSPIVTQKGKASQKDQSNNNYM